MILLLICVENAMTKGGAREGAGRKTPSGKRSKRQYTIDQDLLHWIEGEAARRQVCASDVVNLALRGLQAQSEYQEKISLKGVDKSGKG